MIFTWFTIFDNRLLWEQQTFGRVLSVPPRMVLSANTGSSDGVFVPGSYGVHITQNLVKTTRY